MKKIILLILLILTSGCSIKYDLNIDSNGMKEELLLTAEEDDLVNKSDNYNEYTFEYPLYYNEEFLYYEANKKLDGVSYYEKSINETLYGYDVTFKGNFTINDYNKSRILREAFVNYNIGYNKEEKYYYIYLQNLKPFKNNNISKITVNINTNDFEVIENDANEINGSIYTWYFYKSDNNKNDKIILRYKVKTEENEIIDNKDTVEEPKENTTSDLILVICVLTGFVLLLIVIIKVSKKIHK